MSHDPTDFDFGANRKSRGDRKAEWQRYKALAYARAVAIKEQLFKELGRECHECGNVLHLTFHHTAPRDWEPNKCNYLQRMRLYLRDHRKHQLRVLCKDCNSFDGGWNARQRKLSWVKRRSAA